MFFHHPLSKVIFKLSSHSCGYHAAILRLSPGYLRISCRFIAAILRLSRGYLPAILGYLVDLLRLSPAISRLSPGYLAAIFDFRGYRAAISRLSPGYLAAIFGYLAIFLSTLPTLAQMFKGFWCLDSPIFLFCGHGCARRDTGGRRLPT